MHQNVSVFHAVHEPILSADSWLHVFSHCVCIKSMFTVSEWNIYDINTYKKPSLTTHLVLRMVQFVDRFCFASTFEN